MAAKIDFFINNDNLAINTSKEQNYGIGQYFYVKADGTNGSDTDFGKNDCMKITISRIHYKKTIYKPGFVDVEMTIDNFNNFVVNNKKYVDALKVYFLSGQRTLSLEDGVNKYIEGYYITDIALKQKSKNGETIVMVILKAYSPDYFLTLAKYSQVYRGKTLSEIISNTLTETFKEDSSILQNRFKHDYLCHTKKDATTEIKQPYLVQYNETFHDFVVRTANRCGELFYYEDGKLILGVDESNITSDKDIKIQTKTIDNTLPEDLVFSSIPGSFAQNAKTTAKSFMLANTNAMEMAGKGLYYNQNIENVDALITTSADKDNQTWKELTEKHWLEIGNKILGASGAFDAVFGATNKLIDLSETAGLLVNGVLLENKKKITLLDDEVKLNNLYHTEVAKLGTDSDPAKEFIKQYEADHPEEFVKIESSEYEAFSDANSLASQALAAYINTAKNAKRDHEKTWKEQYFEAHKEEEFASTVNLTDEQIFAKDTEAGKALEGYKNSTRQMTPEETRAFKRDYKSKHPDEFKDATNTDEIEAIWNNEDSPAHKAFVAANSIKPTDDEVKAWKENYKKEHPDQCKKTTYKDKDVVCADPTTNMYRAFQNYKKSLGNTYDEIIKDEDVVKSQCGTYFNGKNKTADELWAEILVDTECEPYKKLVEKFKDKYKKSHASEFTTDVVTALTDAEKTTLWADKEKNPYKALDSYLSNGYDLSTLSNSFYAWIEKTEKRNSASIQVHKLSDNNNIPTYKLGQYYKIGNSSENSVYIINQVEVEINSETSSKEYKIDSNISFSRTETNKERACETSKYQYRTFPPLAEVPHIRKAEPQVAVVTDVADPQRAGRVQIRYPWMKKEGAPKIGNTTLLNSKGKPAGPQYSPWIPVLVPFAGGSESGFLMTPDKDDMVMINYEGGNIERPYVDGSLFCGGARTYWGKTPLIPKANDFRSTKHIISYKGNGISFLPGSADAFTMSMLPGVFGTMFTAVGSVDTKDGKHEKSKKFQETFNNNMTIGGGMVLTDHYGMYNISMSSASRSIDIESPWGNVNLNAFSGITISAPNGDIKIAGKNVTIEAGNNIKMISGKNIKSKHVDWASEITNGLANSAGVAAGAFAKWAAKNTIGLDLGKMLDLSFVRNVWEIICRPVEGSLTMDSKRNVIVQAGGSKAEIPAETLSSTPMAKKCSKISSWTAIKSSLAPLSSAQEIAVEKEEDKEQPMHKLQELAVRYFNAIDTSFDNLGALSKTFRSKLAFVEKKFIVKPGQDASWKLKKKGYNDPDSLANSIIKTEKLDFETEKGNVGEWISLPLARNDNELQVTVYSACLLLKTFINAFNNLVDLWANIKASLGYDNDTNLLLNRLKDHNMPKVKWVKNTYGFDQDTMDNTIPEAISTNENITKALGWSGTKEIDALYCVLLDSFEDQCKTAAKILKRLAFNEIVTESDRYTVSEKDAITGKKIEAKKSILSIKDLKDAKKWKDYTGSLDIKIARAARVQSAASSFLKGAGLGDLASYDDSSDSWSFANSIQQTFNINGKSGPRAFWDVSTKRGVILMSGSNGDTQALGMKEKKSFDPIKKTDKTNDFKKALKKIE